MRHGGVKRSSEAVPTRAEAKMLEAKVKFSMGGAPSGRDARKVAEVVAGYISDGVTRLSPGSIDLYRTGEAALPLGFAARPIATVTPLVESDDQLHERPDEDRQQGSRDDRCRCVDARRSGSAQSASVGCRRRASDVTPPTSPARRAPPARWRTPIGPRRG